LIILTAILLILALISLSIKKRNQFNEVKIGYPPEQNQSEKESNPIPKEYLDAVAGEGMTAE